MPSTPPDESLPHRLRQLRDRLQHGLVERDVEVRLALLAMLAGEHLLLIGPPGTAKSLIARRLRLALADATYFERLLTRFTVPEELFGPLSIRGLENDRYERLTEGYLPTASVAFLDEIFKANSAILNALLTLLNERAFDNGTTRNSVPLAAVIGASNELPEGTELDALFDRFLLRLSVGPVSAEAFPSLLKLRGEPTPDVPAGLGLTEGDLNAVRSAAEQVAIPEDVAALLCALRQWCSAESIVVSDRRWRKVVKVLQVSAWTNGRDRVSVWDCWLLQHCLWHEPDERDRIHAWYEERVGTSAAMDPSRLTAVVVSWEQKLDSDRGSRTQMRDEQGRLLYGTKGEGNPTARATRPTTNEDGEPLYLAPTGASLGNRLHRRLGNGHTIDRSNDGHGYTIGELDESFRIMNIGEWFAHWSHRDSYLADPNNRLTEEVDLPPLLEPTRHKAQYVDACLTQIRTVLDDVQTYHAGLVDHIESMEQEIREHLWVTSEFSGPARASLDRTLDQIAELETRVVKLANGFEMLPRETDESPTIPPSSKPKRTRKRKKQ